MYINLVGGKGHMRASGWLVSVGVVVFVVQAIVVLTQQQNAFLAGDGLSVVLALAAALGCLVVWKKLQHAFYLEKKGWLLTSLAFFLFASGDGIWAYYEFFHLSQLPVFLVPQIFWTLAYVFWIFGLKQFLETRFFPSRAPVIGVMAASLGLAVLHAYKPFLQLIHDGRLLIFLNSLYVSYDYILLGLVVLIIAPFIVHHTRLLTTWVLLSLAIVARILFDFILVNSHAYWSGHPAILLYSGAYVLCLLAAHAKLGIFQDVVRKWLYH